MPPKGAELRGRQLATLSAMAHRMFTDAEVGRVLERLAADRQHLSDDDLALLDVCRYDFDRATRLPESFVHEFAQTTSQAYEAWVGARKNNHFKTFQPWLQKVVDLCRRKADYMGYTGSPYNALLEEFERGMTVETLKPLFADLAAKQSALVERIKQSPNQPDTDWTEGTWDESAQWALCLRALKQFGYDLDAGRQDKSVHPFSMALDMGDVRITTRINPKELFSALTGTMHEAGHGLYSQGHDRADAFTPVADGPSLGIHESQSRMWENLIGRSLPFWKWFTPILREAYPGRLDSVTPETVYQAINAVAPSLIRVEADECTYNLHVILRFEIEVGLIEGTLKVADVPEAWNAKIKQYLGLDVPNDAQGCLQDIHWSHGGIGYFPTYTLGNLYAAHLFETIQADIPELWSHVEKGEFKPLLDWLREKIHRIGRRKLTPDILREATGKEPTADAYLRYLNTKFGSLYKL